MIFGDCWDSGEFQNSGYFSKVVISSGDSMAREGAQLGVPSFYCGVRDMFSNRILIDKGLMFKIQGNKLLKFIGSIINSRKNVASLEKRQLKKALKQ